MKKIPLYLFLIFSMSARSQEKGTLNGFDADWKKTKQDKARFLVHTYPLNDTCWESDFYINYGPRMKSEQYRDREGKELDGISYYYNGKGMIDSMTTFKGGKKNGDAWKLSGGSMKYKYVYREDALVQITDMDTVKKDSAHAFMDEKESQYPGGISGWNKYLVRNLRYPEKAVEKNIMGQVIVQFVVDKEGDVINPIIVSSAEYSLDEEAIRIIINSGKWDPAFQNGHHVKSFKAQPVNFKLVKG